MSHKPNVVLGEPSRARHAALLRSIGNNGVTVIVDCSVERQGGLAAPREVLRVVTPVVQREQPELLERYRRPLAALVPSIVGGVDTALRMGDPGFSRSLPPRERGQQLLRAALDFLGAAQEECPSLAAGLAIGFDCFDEAAEPTRQWVLDLAVHARAKLSVALAARSLPSEADVWPRTEVTSQENGGGEETPEWHRGRAIDLLHAAENHGRVLELSMGLLPYHWTHAGGKGQAVQNLMDAGSHCLREGFFAEAIRLARWVLSLLGDSPRIRERWGAVQIAGPASAVLGQPVQAELLFLDLLNRTDLRPIRLSLHQSLALLYARAGDPRASAQIEAALALLPGSEGEAVVLEEVQTRNILAYVHYRRGDLAEALITSVSCLERLRSLGSGRYPVLESIILQNMAEVHDRAGRLDGALTLYDAALCVHPASIKALELRAALLGRLERWTEAVLDLDSALALAPEDEGLKQRRLTAEAALVKR